MRDKEPENAWTTGDRILPQRLDFLPLVPLIAIIALVALVSGVIWVVNRNELEQARIKLATDALWVEQTLRFQLSVDEDMLVRLALEAASRTDSDTLDTRARLHISNNPETLSVIWYDPNGDRTRGLPTADATGNDEFVKTLAAAGASGSRPDYSTDVHNGKVTMGLALPDGDGFVTATVSLPLLLQRHIPWWIAEQYGLRILDSSGEKYASRLRLQPAPDNPSHKISFDPPLHGAVVEIISYEKPEGFHSSLVFGAIIALAAFAILALIVLFGNTKRRRSMEMRLRGETAFRRSMEDSLTVGLRARDHSGRILYVNAAFCKLVGHDPEELIGHTPPMPYWDPERVAEIRLRHQKLAMSKDEQQSFETRFLHRDGRRIDVQVYEAPLIDAAGEHRGWLGSIIDITDQKKAAELAREQNETMARTGRLVTLGEMASTLAHELNQPLSAIASYAAGMTNLLDNGEPEPSALRKATEKLGLQASRAGQIIRHIQDLVKKREPRFLPTRLDEVITETVTFLAAPAREHHVFLETELEPVPEILADRILLEQVLINLIRNGMEAMTEKRHGDSLHIRLYSENNQAVIEITDQGAGISEDIEGRLFDAFASTKEQGMGMGLKICRSIIELHRGQLSHRAAPGGGTQFRMSLPLTDNREKETSWAA